ncbi:mobility-associated LCxxNW protein [Butyrivibrio sp. AC2005]|uniref:mobility-associated LCxxNW protein n=1 Tax=Butyrivibrio sp. AC2005 TaxID=1280672 RepID=UPI0003F8BA91|nr:mobility-associated LCxxNW protein [Butyrivibrio sp. AC2005]
MLDYCAFSKDHKCIKWEDYQITLQEIEEADSLCHGNWIEIEKQYNYILELQAILDEHGIDYPILL